MNRSLGIVLCLAGFLISLPGPAVAAHCDVDAIVCPDHAVRSDADQDRGAIVTEGVQFPGVDANSGLGRAARQASNCPECEWTVAPACLEGGPAEEAACGNAVGTCAEPGDIFYRVYMRESPTEPWQLVGTVCLGPGERPQSVGDIGELVRDRVVNLLPDAAPSFQPAQGGLVNLPTLFAANEPGSIRTEAFDVLGFEIVVTATARWEWTFDDGVTQEFDEPGGPYPDESVSYTYARSGGREVSVTTYWTAMFTVDGEGPFAVPGPAVSKTAGPITVPVREARSVLVGG